MHYRKTIVWYGGFAECRNPGIGTFTGMVGCLKRSAFWCRIRVPRWPASASRTAIWKNSNASSQGLLRSNAYTTKLTSRGNQADRQWGDPLGWDQVAGIRISSLHSAKTTLGWDQAIWPFAKGRRLPHAGDGRSLPSAPQGFCYVCNPPGCRALRFDEATASRFDGQTRKAPGFDQGISMAASARLPSRWGVARNRGVRLGIGIAMGSRCGMGGPAVNRPGMTIERSGECELALPGLLPAAATVPSA